MDRLDKTIRISWRAFFVVMALACFTSVAVLATATSAVAGPIKEEEKEKKEKEREELKEKRAKEKAEREREAFEKKYNFSNFYPWCPLRDPRGLTQCLYGKSNKGAYAKLGNVTVPFVHPVFLKGGDILNEETGEFSFVGAERGETLSKTAQPVPGGLEAIVDPELLSTTERERYESVIESGNPAVTATIELAGPASEITVNPFAILEGTGTAIGLPVQVKLSNEFLGKSCTIGTQSVPLRVETTTGKSGALEGKVGELAFTAGGEILILKHGDLVDNEFTAPAAYGCGQLNGADEAINAKTGLPSGKEQNVVSLEGELLASGAVETAAHLGVEYK
jgi:hypothetical protein